MDAKISTLIVDSAKAHNLPLKLVQAIVQVESGGTPDAQRYEPAFFNKYVSPNLAKLKTFGLSRTTEGIQRATSYGLMQVMGEVARENGLTAPNIEKALYDPATCLDYGCRLLFSLAARFSGRSDKWQAVCAAYNGGLGAVKGVHVYSNPQYPAKVAYQLSRLGLRLDDNWSALDGAA